MLTITARARATGRLVVVALLGALASASPAVAQNAGLGMPVALPGIDMSHAPKDIQAIWKKLQSGQMPTPAEGQRLSAWMQAHSSEIRQSLTGQASALRQSVGALGTSGSEAQCPTRSPALATLGTAAPTATAASALLERIHAHYAGLEKPAAVHALEQALAAQSVPNVREVGAVFLLRGYDAATVLAYVAAIHRAPRADAQAAWGDLGAALVGLGDATNAIPVLRYALALGPRSELLVHNLGIAYADLGGLSTATTLLTEVTHSAPRFGGAYDALAKVESCAGNTAGAWQALAAAQDVDWTEERGEELDQHDQSASNQNDDNASSDDDAVEAAKPFPAPSGPSPFPPPPNRTGASAFAPVTPTLPDTWREAAARKPVYDAQVTGYASLDQQLTVARGRSNGSASSDAPGGPTTVFSVSFTNGKEASAGADMVFRRAGARAVMVQRAFGSKIGAIAKQQPAIDAKLWDQLQSCKRAHPGDVTGNACNAPYCKAMNAAWDAAYTQYAGAARVAIGGYAGIATAYHQAMMAWFAWAGDPVVRRDIDQQRLAYLAFLQEMGFTAASTAAGAGDQSNALCASPLQPDLPGTVRGDAANDPGKCDKKSVYLFVVRFDMSCDQLAMTLTPFVIGGPMGQIQYHAATADHVGTMFATLGVGIGPSGALNVLQGQAGIGVTFDQSGLVTGAGPAVGGGIGNATITGRVSGMGMINAEEGGPVAAGSVSATTPAWLAFASTVGFSGKM